MLGSQQDPGQKFGVIRSPLCWTWFSNRISKFHYSWKLPEIFWNPGYCLEGNFLLMLVYWASIQINFCHWTWILPQKWKNFIFLYISCNFWILKQIASEKVEKNCHFQARVPENFLKFPGIWNFDILFENQVSWHELSGIHILHVEINQK